MTIPEFAKFVKSNNKVSAILGDCYDANIILYEMINPYIEGMELSISIEQASSGITKYKITSNIESTDFTNMKERYNNMNIDQFNRSFVSKTRITKNNTFIITLQKYKTN